MKYLLLLSFLNFFQPIHDIAMATFSVTLENEALLLKIKLDVEDINASLNLAPSETATIALMTTYLRKNTSWLVNHQPISFNFISIEKNDEFYLLEATPVPFDVPITKIELRNTTLIEQVAKQSNIIYIKQKGKEVRGFRMTKDRVYISVDL